jgi:xylose isomerase
MPDYQPQKSDKFTFGLWTIGNIGRDPFGEPVRSPLKPHEIVRIAGEAGAYGVNLHDNDLLPIDSTPTERDQIMKDFRKALDDTGLCVPMATTNLFSDPVFRDGGFTSNDAQVRAYTLQKVMQGMDLGASLGAKTYVFWGGREGTEVDASKDPRDGIKYFRDAINFLCEYSIDQDYGMRFALEAKPNEPRGDIFFPTTGNYLGFIETLDHPEMVGVNPEVAHETMAGLNFYHAVGQAIEAGKLFHIDLNDQRPGRYDQDFRFGSESFKICFFLVKLLEESGYEGPRHFDAHAYRTENLDGVKAFAAGCMRTYLILKEKAKRWNEDREIQGLLAAIRRSDPELEGLCKGYSAAKAKALKEKHFDRKAIATHPLPYERLDQLTCEIIYGVR